MSMYMFESGDAEDSLCQEEKKKLPTHFVIMMMMP